MFEDLDTLQQRTQDWPFLESPVKITILCIAYLLFITNVGPKFMKNRPAYSLKNVLIGYNLFQIIVSFYLAKEFLTNGITFRNLYQCTIPDYSDSPQNMYRAKLMYYTFLLKIVELIETIFFVLRKKQKQISTLHVYHHISTMYIAYFGAKYIGCGLGCIGVVLNCIVHFLMYLYYLVSAFGDANWQRIFLFYKKAITKLQIVQFLIMLFNGCIIFPYLDEIGMVGFMFAFPDILLLLYMFVKFYNKSYSSKSMAPTVTNITTTKIN